MDTNPFTILYYPKTIITNSAWLRQVILYNDAIGSILPETNNVDRILEESYDMQILNDRGYYRPFFPDRHVRQDKQLVTDFKELLSKQDEAITLSNVDIEDHAWLYERKFFGLLADELVADKIAIRNENRLVMRKKVVLLYMSLLARDMANNDLVGITVPGTDENIFLSIPFPKSTSEDKIPGASLTIQNILPIPREDVQISDILKFKENRKDEMDQFREVLVKHQKELKAAQELNELRELNKMFVKKLEREVTRLSRVFERDSLSFRLGTLTKILTLSTPSLVSSLADGLTDQVRIAIAAGGTIAAGAIILCEHFLDAHNKLNEKLDANSFSYLYYAKKEGIIDIPSHSTASLT